MLRRLVSLRYVSYDKDPMARAQILQPLQGPTLQITMVWYTYTNIQGR